jgi:hypothetical protein
MAADREPVAASVTDDSRSLTYTLLVCPRCRTRISWLPDDGEGMYQRGWCDNAHLVIDQDALRITVAEVVA